MDPGRPWVLRGLVIALAIVVGALVYIVDPDDEVQVEVYAPSAKRAIGLVRSGQVQPVG